MLQLSSLLYSLQYKWPKVLENQVRLWRAIEDLPEGVSEGFINLELLSAFLVTKQKRFARHIPYDMVFKRIFIECHKWTGNFRSKSSPIIVAFSLLLSHASGLYSGYYGSNNNTYINMEKRRTSVGESWVAVQKFQQDTIS